MNDQQSTLLIVALFVAATLFAAREKGKIPQGHTIAIPTTTTFEDVESTASTPATNAALHNATSKPRHNATPAKVEGTKYSSFQVAMWFLKSHESFRPYEYPDGDYPSKGFGLNLTPAHEQWATNILGFPSRSRDWTWDEGTKILRAFWQRKNDRFSGKNLTTNQRTAIMLHSYNAGKYKDIQGCCGAKKGCGRKGNTTRIKAIRKAHNERREFEWKLYQGLVTNAEIEQLRANAIKVESKWKTK